MYASHPEVQAGGSAGYSRELLESFGNGPMTAEAINAVSLALKKALIERALAGEMNHHLGYRAVRLSRPMLPTSAMARGQDGAYRGRPCAYRGARDRDGSFAPLLSPSTNGVLPVLTTRSSTCTLEA